MINKINMSKYRWRIIFPSIYIVPWLLLNLFALTAKYRPCSYRGFFTSCLAQPDYYLILLNSSAEIFGEYDNFGAILFPVYGAEEIILFLNSVIVLFILGWLFDRIFRKKNSINSSSHS